jgi:2-polyprenyl-6-methoxyphenol hydroxylase-like FAD-dependent oxidoreductase
MWAVFFPADEFDDTGADTVKLQDAASACARRFPVEFKKIVDEGDPTDTVLTPIRAATPVSPWTTRRVTLMGDAIHAMPPVGTRGANTALNDARVLAEQLVAVHHGERDLFTAIRAYEHAMLTYGFDAVHGAQAELQRMIGAAA